MTRLTISFALFLSVAFFWLTAIPSAFSQSRGQDVSPRDIKDKYYDWGSRIKTAGNLASANKDIWYSRYSAPMDGYIILKSGERLEGRIVVHNKWNKASTEKIAYETTSPTGQKTTGTKPDPDGVDIIESVKLITADGEKEYSALDIKYYGPHFKMSDWVPDKKSKNPADKYLPGYVLLKSGRLLEGMVCLYSWEEASKGIPIYGRVFFAAEESAHVEMYYAKYVKEAAQVSGEKTIIYDDYKDRLIHQKTWVDMLSNSAKTLGFDNLLDAKVRLDNGNVYQGRVALNRGKKKRQAIFADQDNDLTYYDSPDKITSMILNEGGDETFFFVADGRFISAEDKISELKKKGDLHDGVVILEDGTELKGKVSRRMGGNLVKSYQVCYGFFLIPDSDRSRVLAFGIQDGIDHVKLQEDGKEVTYVAPGEIFIDYADYLGELKTRDSKDPVENLNPGWVSYRDGSEMKGQVAREKSSFVLVDGNEKIHRFTSGNKNIDHVIQQIDGQDRKFIWMPRRANAVKDAGFKIVEIHFPDAVYSYYSNPYPTHIRERLTKFVQNTTAATVDAARIAAANAAAKYAVKQEMQQSGSAVDAVIAGTEAQYEVMDESRDMVQFSDDDGIYYKEWVVRDNRTGAQTIVYEENAAAELSGLLSSCPSFASLSNRETKSLMQVANIHDAVQYLNGCRE